jgi:hypothetical protein
LPSDPANSNAVDVKDVRWLPRAIPGSLHASFSPNNDVPLMRIEYQA